MRYGEYRQRDLAPCFTPQCRAMQERPAKAVHHRCGYPLVTKVVKCWGPSLNGHAAMSANMVLVGYWDAETRLPVYVCPGCQKELRVWWQVDWREYQAQYQQDEEDGRGGVQWM